MPKDASYHRSAVYYNEQLAIRAEELVGELEHEEIQRWAGSVGKQHRFHESRHAKALAKIENGGKREVQTEDGGEDRVVDDERVVHKSAVDGQFVSEEEAEENPSTTYETTVVEHHIDHSPEGEDVSGDAPVPAEPMPVEDAADPSETPAPVQDGPPVDEGVDVSETPAQAAQRLQEELNDGRGV